jgi:eukaryotic-like serine/threonine-protein kinase
VSLQSERALFDACSEIPAAEREAWLARHCDDAALRARVMRLLNAHDQAEARGALETSAFAATRRIGAFELLEPLGEGAMGEVWLAQQMAPVRRRVALKIVKTGMGSREVIARFELERQTLAIMSHPNIAHIIEAGTTDDGRPYFAMEYVPGVPVTTYCDQHRLSVDARLQLFMGICEAVQHAHQKGVIHRDLKPGNLLITELDGRAVPKVIDFGIAKAVAWDQQPSRAHTLIGHLIGTPEYMSPEQAQLSPLDVDTRADVYSLGVVLHELLTGALPFRTSDPNASPAVLVKELMTHDPTAPSARVRAQAESGADPGTSNRGLNARQLAARLSGDLDWIVLKALEKDRTRRYASPAELAADIRRHLSNQPVLAGPPSAVYRMRKFASRHRIALTLAGGVFTASLIFGALMAHQAHEVALQRDEARYQAQRAEASSEFMSLMLEEVGPGGRPLSPLELVDKGVEMLDKRYSADPGFTARMLLQMSRRYMDLNSTEKQTQVLARALNIATELDDPDLLADIQCTIVRSELDANRYERAAEHLTKAQVALARVSTPSLSSQVDCLRAEADIAETQRDFTTAAQKLQQAQKALEEAGNTRGLQYHAVLTDLGGIYFRTSRFREALELNEQTAEALDRNGRGGTLGRVTVATNRASILQRMGEISQAERAGLEAIQRAALMRGDEPAMPAQAIAYAITLLRLERVDEAVARLTAASEQAHALGNDYWAVIADYHLARAHILLDEHDNALLMLDEVERAWSSNATANQDRLADLARTRAEVAIRRGKLDDARRWIESSLKQFGYPSSATPPGLVAALLTASTTHLQLKQFDQAESFAKDALKIAESIARDPGQSADVGEALLVLASIRQAQGDRATGTAYAERALEALSASLGSDHRFTRQARATIPAGRE